MTAARKYLARHLSVVPVPLRKKKPVLLAWQDLRLTEAELPAHFAGGGNIGVLNGEPSEGIVDGDLDTPEAIAAADAFMPRTALVFGHASNPRSHRTYRCNPPPATRHFKDCDGENGRDETMLCELRSTGSQTIWPPSTHPDGDTYAFNSDGEPAEVDGATLLTAMSRVAACALLARHWPKLGSRHDSANALGGYLLRGGLDEAVVVKLVETAAKIAGTPGWRERGRDVRATAKALRTGKHVTGGPTLSKLRGEPVVAKLREWLGLHSEGSATDSGGFTGEEGDVDGDSVTSVTENGEEWPELIPLAARPVPAFPTDALPPVPAALVRDVARVVQIPPDVAGVAVLVVLGTTVARCAEVAIGGTHVEPLNSWGAAIAESGERKGPALRPVLKPVYDYQRRLQEEAAPGIQAAAERRKCAEQRVETLRKKAGREDNRTEREALVDEAAQLATELPSVPPRPALVVSDRTPEKLEVDLAEQDGALLMASEEAGSLFEIAGGRYSRDGGAQLDTYLKAYDGGEIDTARIGRAQVVCDRPALSIIVTPQPLLVQQLRERPEFHHRGLLPRFLWAFPATRVGRRPYDATVRENIHVRQAYAQLVGRLLDWRRQHTGDTPMRLCIVGEALDIWAGYANRVEEELREGGRLHAIREWGSKQAGRVARIAGGLHVADTIGCGKAWQENISTATLRAACRLGEYSEAHALATYDEMRADPRVEGARKVLAWITRTKKTQFTAREAFRGVHSERFHAMADLDPCLGLLIEFGYLRLVAPRKAPGRGRPVSPRYVVNPALHRKSVTEVTITRGPAGNGRDPSEDDDDPGEDREPISA